MVYSTKDNVDHHIHTVGLLRDNLDLIRKDVKIEPLKKRKPRVLNLKAKRGEVSQRNNGIQPGAYSSMAQEDDRPQDYEGTKVKIVKTLEGINGTMREFSQHIESKMLNAFNSKSGKKYGMEKTYLRKYGSHSTLRTDDYEAMQREAIEYLAKRNYKL